MDVLSCSRFVLSLFGFEFERETDIHSLENSSSLTTIRKILLRCVATTNVLVLLAGTALSPYLAYQAKKVDMKLLMAMFTFFFGTSVCVIIVTVKNLPLASHGLSKVLRELPQKDLNYLRKYDVITMTLRMAVVIVSAMGMMSYFLLVPTNDRQLFYNEAYNQNMIFMIVHFVGLSIGLHVIMTLSQFYIIVLTVGKRYALYARNIVHQIHERHVSSLKNNTTKGHVLLQVKSSLDNYYSFVRHINDCMGYIPLAMFTYLFGSFVYAMTAISQNNDLSLGFILVVFGSTIANQLHSIKQAIFAATKATNTIEEVVTLASALSTEPIAKHTPFDVTECRRSLTVFLEQQSIVPYTAQSTFTLEPSILLSFGNAVVPFTVMIITTISSMK